MGSLSIGQFGRTNYYGGAAFSAFFVKVCETSMAIRPDEPQVFAERGACA
jgi:hypothetical protein